MTTTATAPARTRPGSREAWLLGGLILLAAALRFATLGVQSLDADEGFTAEIARKSFGAAMSQIPHTESTPPLYYALVWLWTKLFGTTEWGLRSLSALAGTALVPVVYAIGTALKSRRTGLIAAAFVAVSPLLVWYSQEARAYSLYVLLAAVAFLFLVRGRAGWWALASAAALATHYFAAVVVVPMALWLLYRRGRTALWAVAGVALAAAALAPLLVHQAEHVSRPWADALSVTDELLATSQSFLVGMTWTWLIHRPGVIVLGLLAVAMAWRARKHREALLPGAVAAFGLAVPFLSTLLGAKYFTPGNELAVWPLVAVVLAIGASRLPAAAFCAGMLAITVAVPLDAGLQRENWRDVVHGLRGPLGIVVLNGFEDTRVVSYYLRRPAPPYPVGEIAVLGRPREVPSAFVAPPLAGMRGIAMSSEGRIAAVRYAGPPALVPDHAYGRKQTGSLYKR
jgi:4-amino-4-deoxy-L-arabinose transferase-like glycosyltransferase